MKIRKKYSKKNKQEIDKGLKILTRKHILQKLTIALAQVKAGNTSENLLNEIRQIIYSLYRQKKSIQQYNEFKRVIKQN